MIAVSKTLKYHIYTLVFRVCLLAAAIVFYVSNPRMLDFTAINQPSDAVFLALVWVALFIGMLLRIIPNKFLATGAGKHFGSRGKDTVSGGDAVEWRLINKRAGVTATVWILFNSAVFAVLLHFNMLSPPVAIILVLFYAVCDLFFIIFICPFQILFFKNRCCAECRIYNWDYIMMCTPLFIFPSVYSLTLIIFAIIVLIKWETTARRTPQLFMRQHNKSLNCPNCADKMCFLNIKKKPRVK